MPGATTRDGFLRMTEALTHDPALALVELGANDLFQEVLVADARANLVMINDRVRRAGVGLSPVAVGVGGRIRVADCRVYL